ncbi:MAG: PhoH family protein [Oscillospiraceae bacterium]
MAEKNIEIESANTINSIFGAYDANIKLIEKEFNVAITNRGTCIKVCGEDANIANAAKVINNLIAMENAGDSFDTQTIRYMSQAVKDDNNFSAEELSGDCVTVTVSGKPIKAKTLGQKKYLGAINDNTVTICVGPAGTGKTYLAVATAVRAFKKHEISKIILTRPAVEAGEKLGFLPGDLQNKVDPYLRPLYDALFDMLGAEAFQRNLEKGAIEVAPLAYMRGRTLDDAFIILDEAQNTTPEQMKMFLTRLGFNSKIVITGDITQIDLADKRKSGLIDAVGILDKLDDIAIIRLSNKDVVRHHLVQAIIKAYETASHKRGK